MKKRLFSIVLSLCMVMAFMPQMVFANTVASITYLDASGEQQTCNSATVVTSSDTEWIGTADNPGWYVAQDDVTIESRVTVTGDVRLILADGYNLTVNGDISGGSLTIYGQAGGSGSLTVSGSITGGNGRTNNDGDDMSGNSGGKGGEITINGGIIKANSITSGSGGNGGGALAEGGDGGNGGNITINGGIVEAGNITSGRGGNGGPASEGSGGNGGAGGSIIINGGIVEASSIASGSGGNGDKGVYGRGGNGGNGSGITKNAGIIEAASITSGSGGKGGSSKYGNSGSSGSVGLSTINNGIVFQGNSGQVYGTSVTLSGNFTIPDGKTLTIDSGKTLIIPDGVTLTNNGTIYVDGTFTGTADNLYYPLTLVNATATGDTSEHNSKNYAKAGSTIELSAAPEVGKIITWNTSPTVEISSSSFTMPAAALTVTAQWTACTHNGEKETRNAKEATCTEKGYSGDEYCLVCNEMITNGYDTNMASHKLNHITKMDATVTETGNDEYWQCNACQQYFSDAEGTNEIADLESWKSDAGKIDKLPPEIIEGMEQRITAGEKKELSFTSNAAFDDFKSVTLDGRELSAEYYEKAEGSIIITLNADYVATLPVGEHTIGIVSESGTATTTFTVAEKAAPGTSDDSNNDNSSDKDNDSKTDSEDSAKTGDDINLALWIALMLLAGAGITGTTIYTRRKRTNE